MKIKKVIFSAVLGIGALFFVSCTNTKANDAVSISSQAPIYDFAVYGDSRNGYRIHKKIVNQISIKNPDFVINTGDLVYSGNSNSDWSKFLSITKNLRAKRPLPGLKSSYFVSVGNHDVPTTILRNVFNLKRAYYSFNFQKWHFVFINTEINFMPGSKQFFWLVNNLNKNKDKEIIVVGHEPAYSSGPHGNNLNLISTIVPQLEKYHAEMMLSGHDHIYERTKPILDNRVDMKNGILYLISGGGGAPLYPVTKGTWWTDKALSSYNFINFKVYNDKIVGITYNQNGKQIDSFEVKNKKK